MVVYPVIVSREREPVVDPVAVGFNRLQRDYGAHAVPQGFIHPDDVGACHDASLYDNQYVYNKVLGKGFEPSNH